MKCKHIKQLENSIGQKIDDLGCGYAFLATIAKAWSFEEIIDKLDFIKVKNFCSATNNANRITNEVID